MVSYLITGLLVGFRTDWPRRKQAMKTAGRGTQNGYATVRSQPSTCGGRPEQILLNHVGWKARKNPVIGDVFFLDFPFYRTDQKLASGSSAQTLLLRLNEA